MSMLLLFTNVETDEKIPYLVMQYVSGQSLQTRVDEQGPLKAKEVLRVAIAAANGLAAAHTQGLVHRDVKPGNILLENGVERALLTDFGLARVVDDATLTQTGIVAGTPHYMSPEQADGNAIDHRGDLFSLGSVLYFAATGRPPFRAERPMAVLRSICDKSQRPVWDVNPDIPDELCDLIEKLLEKRPEKRPSDASQVASEAGRLLSQIQNPNARPRRRFQRWLRRRRKRLALFASVAVALFSAAALKPLLLPRSDNDNVHGNVTSKRENRRGEAADAEQAGDDVAPFLILNSEGETAIQELTRDINLTESTKASSFISFGYDSWRAELDALENDIGAVQKRYETDQLEVTMD